MKLVFADKEQPFLMVLQSYLEDLGHRVEIAETANHCLERLRTTSPELLILGNLLQRESEEVLATMQAEEALRQIPIILVQDPHNSDNPTPLHVIERVSRPIRPGAIAKLLLGFEESQQRIIKLDAPVDGNVLRQVPAPFNRTAT